MLIFIGNAPFDPNDQDPVNNFGTPAFKETIPQEAGYDAAIKPFVKGRYIALVFTNSRNSSGYVDLWELVPFGYLDTEMD